MIFTCLSTRAVYLDIAISLLMTYCLNVIKQFLATYGDKTKCFYSDNGTNFAGTDKAIRRIYNRIKKQKYKCHFANKCIEWHFNTPLTGPQVGAWERIIRSVRCLLTTSLDDSQWTTVAHGELCTMLAGAQRILNARPLTSNTHSIDDHKAIVQ